jgi:hypothetical protein
MNKIWTIVEKYMKIMTKSEWVKTYDFYEIKFNFY